MISGEVGPLVKNQERFAENPGCQIRKIVAERCGVGRAAVGAYLKEHMDGGGGGGGGGGFLRSAFHRASVKKTRARRL